MCYVPKDVKAQTLRSIPKKPAVKTPTTQPQYRFQAQDAAGGGILNGLLTYSMLRAGVLELPRGSRCRR